MKSRTNITATCWGFNPSGEEPTHVGFESAEESREGAQCDPPKAGERLGVMATCRECGGGDFTMGERMRATCDECGTLYLCTLANPEELVWS